MSKRTKIMDKKILLQCTKPKTNIRNTTSSLRSSRTVRASLLMKLKETFNNSELRSPFKIHTCDNISLTKKETIILLRKIKNKKVKATRKASEHFFKKTPQKHLFEYKKITEDAEDSENMCIIPASAVPIKARKLLHIPNDLFDHLDHHRQKIHLIKTSDSSKISSHNASTLNDHSSRTNSSSMPRFNSVKRKFDTEKIPLTQNNIKPTTVDPVNPIANNSTTNLCSIQLPCNVAMKVLNSTLTVKSCENHKEIEFLPPYAPQNNDNISSVAKAIQLANHNKAVEQSRRETSEDSLQRIMLSQKIVKSNHTENKNLEESRYDVQLRYHNHNNNRPKSTNGTPHHNKLSKKQLKLAQAQLEKLAQNSNHLHAFFSAVEHGHLDKARTILESTDVNVNSTNLDGLTPLDVAVLSNNRSMTRMLLQHGAAEGPQCSTDSLGSKLNDLLKDAESRIHDLSSADSSNQAHFASRPSISSIIIGSSGSYGGGCAGNETDKQIGIWERRIKGLRRMLLGWDQARPPDAPASVTVYVTGEISMTLKVLEPFEGAISTKFKVQWSTRADFSNIVGEREIVDWRSFHGSMGANCNINGLTQGRRYFIRANCGNFKGWGPFRLSVPVSVIPSSWKDLNHRSDRYLGQQKILDNLCTAVRLARPSDVFDFSIDISVNQRRNHKKKTTIKQLFSVASKFHKNLKRGIYLACIVYFEDKILVTSEDFLPVIEIDETYPSSLHSDYHWFMKVACGWEDVKSLKNDMERNLTSAVHFRMKLLSAASQMQSALGLTDLGQLFHKPLRDSHGTIVLSCIQTVKSPKSVSILNSRWMPTNKIQKKIIAAHEDNSSINEMLLTSITEQKLYHHTSTQRLSSGLYLGYLKMQCSVEQIQIVVPLKTPNVLPHCKVRENAHITADEWEVIKRNKSVNGLPMEYDGGNGDISEVQRLFLYDLNVAAHKLFKYMNIKANDAVKHRLYDTEVIEHSKDVSFLVICPSVESSCAIPGQSENLLQRDDLLSLTIQSFEIIHLRTYQNEIIQKYSRLSCILELDTSLANHLHREAFSSSELQIAKERLAKLQDLTSNLNAVWKSVRWLMDVIAFARDKSSNPSVSMKEILDFSHSNEKLIGSNSQLLQLPLRDVKFTKSGQGRGSWPGPAVNSNFVCLSDSYLATEHSKSEQNLGVTHTQSVNSQLRHHQVVTANLASTIGASMEKKGSDSKCSSQLAGTCCPNINSDLGVFAIPPSRSHDTLGTEEVSSKVGQRKRSTTAGNLPTQKTMNSQCIKSSSTSFLPTSSTIQKSHDTLECISTDCENSSSSTHSCENTKNSGRLIKATLRTLQQTEITPANGTILNSVNTSITTKTFAHNEENSELSECFEVNSKKAITTATATTTTAASQQQSGIIQVYTAYNTGVASGTSLKLHVTTKTSAREVINLVVKQLNMAAVVKGNNGPIYTADKLDNFCLVAVIGARERCLRDDFKPLQLQNPWKKGRLYVRQKHDLLAAIEHSNCKSDLI